MAEDIHFVPSHEKEDGYVSKGNGPVRRGNKGGQVFPVTLAVQLEVMPMTCTTSISQAGHTT